ncbi:uncharacterized protein EAF02_006242 [Botrytis sinoallii]|uniref:uncharacterized protein n=1 Tax=Botrytis sinoallii TaxID=1463999 RepID=UPI001901F83C|nr:uncharacterized protein EAF02_006242 [Botrytis sinoallii]KAF7881554.1 hypothetical protein EAF02_006242 [Botrytis sinoallii]
MSAQNPFPPDGDVLIMSPTGKNWKLHSWQLVNYAPKIGALLKNVAARTITKGMRAEAHTIRWWIEMIPFGAFDDQRFRDFVCVPEKKKGKLTLHSAGAFNGIGEVSFERTYDNLFRMLYSMPPNLTDDIDDGGANLYITDCVSILQAAAFIGSLPSVRTYIESYLLRINQKLWVHVAKAPEAWSDVAVRLQSAIIFRESIIHIAGGLELPGLINRSSFDNIEYGKICLKVAERKCRELRDKKIDVERRLLQYYPQRLIRRETPEKIPGRADYGSDIYYWQALTMCRQFFQSSIMANRHHRHEDDEFHQLFAMSTKGKQCLADAVEVIKDDHRVVIADLLEDHLQLRTTVRSKPLRFYPRQIEDGVASDGSASTDRAAREIMNRGGGPSSGKVPGKKTRTGKAAMARDEGEDSEEEGEQQHNDDDSSREEDDVDEGEYMGGA